MIKVIPVEEAVGTQLAHDVTEIRPGEFKGPAFRKGHTVCGEDVCRLQKLGKNRLYVIELEEDEIHEDEAAALLADALAGRNIRWENAPREGKINLLAAADGLLRVRADTLAAFNMMDEVMCATLHNHTLVREGDLVAATRAIPLVMKRAAIERAAAVARSQGPVVEVLPVRSARGGLVVTGNEVYHGLIQDRFAPVIREKLEKLGGELLSVEYVPDDAHRIARAVEKTLEAGCDLVLLTGGMSVDPDDVTREGIRAAGAVDLCYGSAVLPGAMFLVARIKDVPVLGVPACALHHRVTVLDLVLPRILAGETVGRKELALLGHGGLCRDCARCTYPHCPFGKGS
ncbi:molybdenum cofactor synthesis domain-containing protein [Desulfacinum infernum DSM 9756]|uniref:Molybdenum cofactor synthesis domain-containing protein n=1 Tax=Desulfacinum infernum DSM 9756 TaxID=1121391 RepID=A0A1M5IQ37_9BACT|nr:molybdopterin-binding protein [Desulfacinum infernum]SHG30365.1 molybdenum cofactor synthesis domain-containing protein [Desulfacinum infernum DSM 9756]